MASPIPPPLDQLTSRTFSFYPPIRNIEHNEWRVVRADWGEVLVANERAEMEVWVPRRFIGQLSSVDRPITIVGLTRELEFKAGSLWPYQRRVLEMPRAVNEGMTAATTLEPTSEPRGFRRNVGGPESRIGKLIAICLAAALLLYVVVVMVTRESPLRPRAVFTARDQSFLELTPRDDYFAVVRALGQPAEDRWLSEGGEIQFRGLRYPDRGYTIVLMGEKRETARYIGAMSSDWRPIHYVQIGPSGDTAAMLRSLKKF